MNEELLLKIEKLPECPGCYIMKHGGEVIYVGKAVNLKNRVRSYFRQSPHLPKVQAMIDKIEDFDIQLCQSNLEALILENNLIKLYKPFYNIRLKDDKAYPFIAIDDSQPFPSIALARRMDKDKRRYFGPYMGATQVRQVIDAIHSLTRVRSCQGLIKPDEMKRPCVEYEMGRCLAPCAKRCTSEEYNEELSKVYGFLQGKYTELLKKMQDEMAKAAQEMQYERAAALRDRVYALKNLMEKQNAALNLSDDRDIIALAQDGLDAMAYVTVMRGGHIIGGKSYCLERAGSETEPEVLESFIMQYYEGGSKPPREVLVQTPLEDMETVEQYLRDERGGAVTLISPQRGEKKALMLTAHKNAEDALFKRNAKRQIVEERTIGACRLLGEAIGMDKPPRRIEGFDISNTQGTLSVASMVVFVNGAPAKQEYRRFRIKTVIGANDFASMNEVISRRLRHGAEEIEKRAAEGKPAPETGFGDLPDLFLIDGGLEQLAFAQRAMHEAGFDIPMFGLAKRLEEIFLPGREDSILLDRRSPALFLIQRIRDEAHRFAITYHRSLRGRASTHSRLEDIPQIGVERRRALMRAFKTIEALMAADVESLAGVKGMSKPAAESLYAALHKEK
ncbi:MAG: excinuclease ABC subunit UvrC [Eubacteriales bacterium]|nr:excinuclease ABC subunit UvrC [Eubacteriales bacterium]MDD3881236.1 excinuclease ABC subunit UvrC [Eubacteriales bacterium]MDD4512154.1 excinuclease ABC subunit UvrC [Eubacteriales bacterium]